MNSRERYLETLLYGSPDKIPFMPGHPRESTLRAWHAQGLPEQEPYYEYLCKTLGINSTEARPEFRSPGASFAMMPKFEEKVLEHANGHYIVRDWMGAVVEISDSFDVTYLRQAKDFVTRKWIKCPVETHGDWEEMKKRYDPRTPGRYECDYAQLGKKHVDRNYILGMNINGPFWQLREWLGFEGLCMKLIEEPTFVKEMISFWAWFVSETMRPVLQNTVLDTVHISEDMAYKGHCMISPAMVREFILPCYAQWIQEIKASGCRIIDMDSDGCIDELIPLWIESGINVCDPIEVAAGCDIHDYRRRFGRAMAYTGGVDKRLIAKGGESMRTEINRLCPVIKGGGYIPGCDHGVPPDISWENFVDYGRVLATTCGWLQ